VAAPWKHGARLRFDSGFPMKALVYQNAHPIEQFAMAVAELPDPELRPADILVEVKAIGINPGEAMFRATKSAEPGGRVLLGLEFSGVVKSLGSSAAGFQVGDRVYGTGDMLRDGAWAELVAIDHRLVARIPDNLSFADAASLPIGSLPVGRRCSARTIGFRSLWRVSWSSAALAPSARWRSNS
jgi:NADPH:quinone reductase